MFRTCNCMGNPMNKLKADVARYCRLCSGNETVSVWGFLVGFLSPRMAPVVLLRLAEMAYGTLLLRPFAKVFSTLNLLCFGIEVSPRVRIGGGLFLPHTVGTVIGAESIGENCTIMQGVTLGSRRPDIGFAPSERPVVGNGVMICAGAKIIGRVMIGDDATIGANAVVVDDVPAFATVGGIPARVLRMGRGGEPAGGSS